MVAARGAYAHNMWVGTLPGLAQTRAEVVCCTYTVHRQQ